MRFGKAARLLLRRDFLAVQERGRKLHAGPYLVLALESSRGLPRLGITVSTRIGNAVVRNRIKRWIREAWRERAARLPPWDVVVIARPAAPAGGLAAARAALEALGRAGGRP